jgi:hypothetical protein
MKSIGSSRNKTFMDISWIHDLHFMDTMISLFMSKYLIKVMVGLVSSYAFTPHINIAPDLL